MNVFGADYSSIYDSLYSDHDVKADVRTVSGLVDEFLPGCDKATICDFGCGTGSHIELLKRTFSVCGVDLSDGMLSIAKAKNPEIDFTLGDVKAVNLNKQFDVALMMSAVMGYQHTNQDVLATLQNIKKHVRPGGLFVFDAWYGPAVLLNKPSSRLKETTVNGNNVLRLVQPQLSAEANLCRCHYKWWMPHDGKIEVKEESHTVRYFFPLEMQLFFERVGFELLRIGQPGHVYRQVDNDNWHVMYVVRV